MPLAVPDFWRRQRAIALNEGDIALEGLRDNEKRVLDVLWRRRQASRVEIAAAIGVTKPAITQILRPLAERGLILEHESQRGLRGQPTRPISLDPSALVSAGVNFSHSYIEVGLIDLAGTLLGVRRTALSSPTVVAIAKVAGTAIAALLAEAKVKRDRLAGVGFALPGDTFDDGSLCAHAYFPELFGAKAKDELSRSLDFDVFVENDGKACAIGEMLLGAGRDTASFMLVHIGHGIGGGIVLDRKLYRGAHGNAGPLGGFFPPDQPRPSGQDLLEGLAAAQIVAKDFDAIEPDAMAEAPAISEWIERAGRQLAEMVPRVASMIDPDLVILGGRLPPWMLHQLVNRIDMVTPFPARHDIPRPPIVPSALGSHAGVIGAAVLPIYGRLLPE